MAGKPDLDGRVVRIVGWDERKNLFTTADPLTAGGILELMPDNIRFLEEDDDGASTSGSESSNVDESTDGSAFAAPYPDLSDSRTAPELGGVVLGGDKFGDTSDLGGDRLRRI